MHKSLLVSAFLLSFFVVFDSPIARAQSIGKGLIINEVYIGTSGTVSDQFIELYNPQSTTQYLDGCMIIQFGASGGALSGSKLTGAPKP